MLHGLDESLHGTLRRRVAMISAVSGASMGALYYGAFEDEPTLDHVVQQALKPSLDEIATAFVSRDIFGVLGLRLGTDRGAALEEHMGTTSGRRAEGQPDAAELVGGGARFCSRRRSARSRFRHSCSTARSSNRVSRSSSRPRNFPRRTTEKANR